jgi:sugar phosphate isomerase/epimerase
MKIGFYTSTLGDRPIAEVIQFAVDERFDAIEIDIRSHIPSPQDVGPVVEAARKADLHVSSLTLFGNQLEPDAAVRAALRQNTRDYLLAAAEAGVPDFVLFPGRNPTVPEEKNYADFAGFAQWLLDETKGSPIRVLMENWPGPNKDFIAITPAGWRRLFALVPDPRLGLEFDPSHLVWQGIDPLAARAEFANRIGILHGKDTFIDEEAVQSGGYFVNGWWRYALPGRGLVNWRDLISALRRDGFDGVISIEHEDRDFGWPKGDLGARLDGHRQAAKYLRASL